MSDLLDYHDALNTLLKTHGPVAGEEQAPLACLNLRVLARDVGVRYDVPAFDNSAMDGYAINGNDCGKWKVVHRIAAGDPGAQSVLQRGEAARIFTGAPLPQGATAVLMQENVHLDTDKKIIALSAAATAMTTAMTAATAGAAATVAAGAGPRAETPVTPDVAAGMNIRRQAEELRHGTTLLPAGLRLRPAAVGLLAEQGYTHAPCVRQVKVTVFATGNELIEPGNPLQPGQIHNSNGHMLAALLRAQGFAVTEGGILPDQLAATRDALKRAAQESDAIVCSGGVSVGEEDHLKAALEEVGELTQWRLLIKPGKPFTWGRIGDCRVFMLPGNPVSSLVTFQQLALPALLRMGGLPDEQARPWQVQARADFSRSKIESRREFLRVSLEGSPDGYRARPMQRQGSAMLSGAVFAQALAEIPPGGLVEPGQVLTVYPLGDRF